jgi:hypothetical protein
MKLFSVALFVVFCCSIICSAAERKIRPGDDLVKLTGFTMPQLQAMNDGKPLTTGAHVRFVSVRDIADARRWCNKRMQELPPGNPNYRFFAETVKDLDNRYFRYSVGTPNGLHFELILDFATAWRKAQA